MVMPSGLTASDSLSECKQPALTRKSEMLFSKTRKLLSNITGPSCGVFTHAVVRPGILRQVMKVKGLCGLSGMYLTESMYISSGVKLIPCRPKVVW